MDRKQPIGHDQLFQDLLESFFADFLELVVPRLGSRLDLGRIDFLREKGFTARPEGRLLIRDLLARVRTRDPPPKSVEFHVEVEGRFRRSMAKRMRRYHHQRAAHRPQGHLISIVLYLTGGPAGVTRQRLEQSLWGEEIEVFHYYAFGLEGCLAEEWVDRSQPLAAALAALMRSQTWDRPEQKVHCLRAVARADINEERRFLLFNLVETYLRLTKDEAQRYAELVALEGHKEIRDMELTWAGRIQEQGVRQFVLDLLKKRFGNLPVTTSRQVEAMNANEIRLLGERLLDAKSLADLDLG